MLSGNKLFNLLQAEGFTGQAEHFASKLTETSTLTSLFPGLLGEYACKIDAAFVRSHWYQFFERSAERITSHLNDAVADNCSGYCFVPKDHLQSVT